MKVSRTGLVSLLVLLTATFLAGCSAGQVTSEDAKKKNDAMRAAASSSPDVNKVER